MLIPAAKQLPQYRSLALHIVGVGRVELPAQALSPLLNVFGYAHGVAHIRGIGGDYVAHGFAVAVHNVLILASSRHTANATRRHMTNGYKKINGSR